MILFSFISPTGNILTKKKKRKSCFTLQAGGAVLLVNFKYFLGKIHIIQVLINVRVVTNTSHSTVWANLSGCFQSVVLSGMIREITHLPLWIGGPPGQKT